MKAIVSIILCLSLMQGSLAATGDLESVIDDFQYFTTIEWDQKDRKALEKRSRQFSREIKDVLARGNVSQGDFFKILERKIPNKRALDRARLKISLAGDELSAEEISEITEEFKQDLYQSGASWNPSEGVQITLFILGTVLFTALLVWWADELAKKAEEEASKPFCEKYPNSNLCDENGEWREYVCTSYRDEWECTSTTTTDYYGNPKTVTNCGWKQVCASGYWKN